MSYSISEETRTAYDEFTKAERIKKAEALKKFLAENKDIALLQKEIGMLWTRCLKNELSVNECENKAAAMQQKLNELLAHSAPMAKALFEDEYYCEKCHDTGFSAGKICSCLMEFSENYSVKASGLGEYLEKENFASFSLDVFDAAADEYIKKASAGRFASAREAAQYNLTAAKRFVDALKAGKYYSLFISGGVGTGKTFLSHCIARSAIESGLSVVIDTAYNVVENLTQVALGKLEKASCDNMFTADLLVIDDLGCERQTDYSQMLLFNLINERINHKKAMVISTNFASSELKNKYDERILSRIQGQFGGMRTFGSDLRVKK